MKVKLHPLSNGKHYNWGKIRSGVDFFFPYAKNGQYEFIRREGTMRVNKDGSIERQFFTFRALFWHYAYYYLINPINGLVRDLSYGDQIALQLRMLLLLLVIFASRNLPLPLLLGAIARDTHSALDTGTSLAGLTATYSYTCTGSSVFLAVSHFTNTGDFLSTGAYGGDSMTIINQQEGAAGSHLYTVYRAGAKTGANNIVLTESGSGKFVSTMAASYSGVSTGAIDASNKNGVTASSISVSVTTTKDNCWILGTTRPDTGTASVGTATTKIDGEAAGGGLWSLEYSSNPKTPAGAQALAMNNSASNNIGLIVISIAPALAKGNFLFLMS